MLTFLYPCQSPFHRLGQQMQDLLGDGWRDQEGSGPTWRRPTSAKRFNFNFSGFLEYSDCLRPPGLELGILTMRQGEFSRFLFLPAYAYGEMGCPPLIPPVATVLYKVQVLDFLDSAQVDDFYLSQTPLSLQEEQNTVPLSTLFNVVDTERSFGNRCFNQSRFEDAKDRYKQAVTLLGNRELEEKRIIAAVQLPIYLNLSLTHKAMEIDPTNTKVLFRCGQAYLELSDYEKAQDYLTMAQANKPFDINNLLRKLATCYKDYLDKEKELCFKMCADFEKCSQTEIKVDIF
uniref:peptidylprolyl isomerase n=1 Tax=Oncorhynchus mykiss TaxID=8022 RepID=A0A8C7PWH4_ONCMY